MVSALSDLALLTTKETAEAEQSAIASGIPGATLMERAGAASALLCQHFSGAHSAAVLCGPGNNGGDGFVVARHLREAGWRVDAFTTDETAFGKGDAAQARQRWAEDVRPAGSFTPESYDLVVDALVGAGLSRPVEGATAALIESANAGRRPVVAIDIASGVDGTTGEIRGVAIRATATVTFGTAKPGHYLYPGRALRGRLTVVDIGLEPPNYPNGAYLNAPQLWLSKYPWPEANGHKYKRGHAVALSGSASHTGAGRLAARAALRIGAGLVTLASPTDALTINASHLTAVMLQEVDDADALSRLLSDPRKNGVILGPGLGVGAATRDLVAAALWSQNQTAKASPPRACLLDADAITSFADEAGLLRDLIEGAPGPVVITPHDGEFARLFSAEPSCLEGSKLDRARAAARLLGCVVLLKGPDTVIAEPSGRATVSEGGSSWLATAGSGDVLSGMIGGLMTQGMPPFEAAAAGDHLHTAAARLFGPGLIAEDLPEVLPKVLSALRDQEGLSEE